MSSQESIKKPLKLNWWWTKLEQQVRELEQQLNKSTQQRQSSVLSGEEEFLGMGFLQKTPPQERNVNYIRTIEKEKRVALEVCIATTTEACRPIISCLAKVFFWVFLTNASHLLNENLNFRDISKVLISNWLWEMGLCIHIKQVKTLYCCKRVLTHMLQVQHFISTQGPKSQQWLQVQCRITFKTLLLVHKPLNGLAPPVHLWLALRSLFNPIRPLRSAGADLLAIPKIRFKCAQVLQLPWSCCLEQASHWLEVNYNCVYMQKQTQTMLSSQAYS